MFFLTSLCLSAFCVLFPCFFVVCDWWKKSKSAHSTAEAGDLSPPQFGADISIPLIGLIQCSVLRETNSETSLVRDLQSSSRLLYPSALCGHHLVLVYMSCQFNSGSHSKMFFPLVKKERSKWRERRKKTRQTRVRKWNERSLWSVCDWENQNSANVKRNHIIRFCQQLR